MFYATEQVDYFKFYYSQDVVVVNLVKHMTPPIPAQIPGHPKGPSSTEKQLKKKKSKAKQGKKP
jgi:hypothetical protein